MCRLRPCCSVHSPGSRPPSHHVDGLRPSGRAHPGGTAAIRRRRTARVHTVHPATPVPDFGYSRGRSCGRLDPGRDRRYGKSRGNVLCERRFAAARFPPDRDLPPPSPAAVCGQRQDLHFGERTSRSRPPGQTKPCGRRTVRFRHLHRLRRGRQPARSVCGSR